VSVLDEALLAHADGDLCAGAAAGLLIAGRWLDRDDFTGRFVTVAASPCSGTRMAVIDWPAAAGALGRSLPCSDRGTPAAAGDRQPGRGDPGRPPRRRRRPGRPQRPARRGRRAARFRSPGVR
jgi:hypothetical protein